MFNDIADGGELNAFITSSVYYGEVVEINSKDPADYIQIWLSSKDTRRLGEHLIELARSMEKEL